MLKLKNIQIIIIILAIKHHKNKNRNKFWITEKSYFTCKTMGTFDNVKEFWHGTISVYEMNIHVQLCHLFLSLLQI